ncbi:TPA: DUF1642 domain-containing protein [Streptococcus suis]|nr:DUF1642 domain-containing protein [Streptococcus suis]HEM4250704.1 DUF1642 domain-containing protein [Streptococcus suis]
MKRNDFYEVNGCTDFIPVTINKAFADGVGVTVHSTTHPFIMAVKQVYQFLKQHEPQKVVVPKFIADSIEYCKNKEGYGLLCAMDYCDEYNDTDEWLEHNQETFALAWLFGYEIEQEKLYTVELPNPNNIGTEVHILMMNGFKQVVIKKELGNDWKKKKGFQLTEEEIKKDFEWAWQFREEVD